MFYCSNCIIRLINSTFFCFCRNISYNYLENIKELILEETGENIDELEAEIEANNEQEEEEFEEMAEYTGESM